MIGLLYLETAYPLGFLVYYIPLVLIVVLLTAFAIRLSRFDTSALSQKLQERHKWVSRLFIILVINWFVYCLVLIIWALNSTNAFAMVGYIVFRLCEAIAAICLARYGPNLVQFLGEKVFTIAKQGNDLKITFLQLKIFGFGLNGPLDDWRVPY